ncbi:DUF411 domain-containing protein [Magnetospira sp. QH-2]|uniref:DUF411 domain-containing protein n=1 Tax=Magnetospira sp. (strain QH-2) TaxID=1288970 RepID=UPI0003E81084|nr:DUF411 domain-containing protein [Magnetospira sp. QH-2]CCQ75682.1 conserved exported protein of unknown function [Magnetospira sp. QH-2]
MFRILALFLLPLFALSAQAADIQVFKSPTCGCCGAWVEIMRDKGHSVSVVDRDDLDLIKQMAGVPEEMQSCHTAMVDGYVLEGHVPPEDVDRLLSERPRARGLAVPGMPAGSPGMEMPDGAKDPYATILFDRDGKARIFQRH